MAIKKPAQTDAPRVPKPPRKPANAKGAPAASAAATAALDAPTDKPGTSKGVPLNFTVPAELRKEWHLFARANDVKGVRLLEIALELVKSTDKATLERLKAQTEKS